MLNKKLMLLAILLFVTLAGTATMDIAWAQGEVLMSVDFVAVVNVAVSWFAYAILGLIASIVGKGEPFDAPKLVRSFLFALLVMILSIATGLHPDLVISQQGNAITTVLEFFMSTGTGAFLIYAFEKIYTTLAGLWQSVQPKQSTTTLTKQ